MGSGGAPAGGASPGELEVFSWWTAGVERSAVEALFTAFNPAYPDAGDGVAITFTEQPDGIVARANLQSRITAGNPPDVFQENAGKLLQDLAGTGEVASLEDLSLWSAIVPDVVEQVSRGGVPYAVPLSVARINSIFYSVDLLGAEFQPPATLAEFHALLESLKANHPEASPLSLGNGFLWTMNLLVWEMVMPAVAGATYYERFWRGDAQIGPGGVDDAALRDVLREALVLYCGVNAVDPTGLGLRSGGACDGYFNADVDTAEWEEPVRAVATGTAAMAPMGDWARNILVAAGSAPTADFGVFQFPGDDVFVWVADTLAMTSDAPNRFNARSFLELAGSKQGQIAFNVPKGSIPARNDIAPEDGLDLLSMSIVGDFTSAAARAPGRSTLGVEPAMSALSQQLRDSLRAHDMAALYQYILDSYAEVGALFP